LDDRTNDRSLVMTSSFTNMGVAALALGLLGDLEAYGALCRRLSSISEHVIIAGFDSLAAVGQRDFRRAVFLASGSGFGAAREAALKMLEMTAGRVSTLCETYLGLRHGPMSYVDRDSLIVCFLSSEPRVRVYETDLLRELDRKKLGLLKLVVGENVPSDVLRETDVAIECPGLGNLGDNNACLVHVVAGQLLAFFRCLHGGLRPDSPSESGVINRVVESFQLHIEGEDGS
jgi:tagatose-6-phosphate ketose/aldose isomerase